MNNYYAITMKDDNYYSDNGYLLVAWSDNIVYMRTYYDDALKKYSNSYYSKEIALEEEDLNFLEFNCEDEDAFYRELEHVITPDLMDGEIFDGARLRCIRGRSGTSMVVTEFDLEYFPTSNDVRTYINNYTRMTIGFINMIQNGLFIDQNEFRDVCEIFLIISLQLNTLNSKMEESGNHPMIDLVGLMKEGYT